MGLALVVLIPFLIIPVLIGLRIALRTRPVVSGSITAATLAALFVLALTALPEISASGPVTLTVPWVPDLGLTLSLYVDGLALLFILLVTGIGTAVMFFAGTYFDDGTKATRFLVTMLAFTGSMLALVAAGNILTLFIAWELTSITSFLLIGFYGKDPAARRGASQALVITGGGGLALLVGLLVMGSAAGSMELADILASGDVLRAHPWYAGIVVLILIGAFTKSAQVPFHFWLPGAMSAPSPASAFLHSATMVKAGIYLLARMSPALGDTPLWTNALMIVGLLTMAIGVVLSLRQRDLKAMLAYTTISQLGSLVLLIGLPGGEGLRGAYVGIIAHGLYKCALFLVAGAVDHAAGTRDITRLGGLRHKLPGFAAVTGIAVLSMAGVPPLLGFVGKELLIEAAEIDLVPLIIVVTSAALMVALGVRLFWDVFMRPAPEHNEDDHAHGHDLPRLMVAGPALLAGLSIVLGLGVTPLLKPLIETAVGEPISLYLFPPYGLPLAFWLSMLALAAGTAVFLTRRFWLAWTLPGLPRASTVYDGIVGLVEAFGDLLLRSQNGKIRHYLVVILTAVVALLAIAIFRILPVEIQPIVFRSASDVLKAVLLVLALIATAASVFFNRHLLAALSLGLAGYAIGGIFLLEPAPDVALVQFLVETLGTVLIILILARTSEDERRQAMAVVWGASRSGMWRDALIAAVMGILMTVFALAAVNNRPNTDSIANWYLENADQVGVTDVVAGIITDFRGTDTLIEITVFSMAALGVLTLLARPTAGKVTRLLPRRRKENPSYAADEQAELPDVYTARFTNPVTQLAAELVLPFAILIAIAHIAYAGVAPGDGFTAGVIIGLGIALWYVVFGYAETKHRLKWLHPTQLIGIGLTIAVANAAAPLLFGREFLAFTRLTDLSLADIKLASTTIFEIGICLSVFGGISTIMEAISHPKECEPL